MTKPYAPVVIAPHPLRGTPDLGSERIAIFSAEIRAAEGATDERPIIQITSTSKREDRHGSTIVKWIDETFMRTGHVLWQHDVYPAYPYVGKKLSNTEVGETTVSEIELLIAPWRHMHCNLPAFLWETFRDHGMGAISRAFMPLKWSPREATTIPKQFAENTQYDVVEQTEESFVNVPSNRDAFARGMERVRTAGRFSDGLARLIGLTSDDSPYVLRLRLTEKEMNRSQIVFGERGIRVAGPFDFASTQVNLEGDVKEKVLAIAAAIPDDVIAEKGRETDPHITVKFGIAPDVKVETIIEALANSDSVREMVMKGGAEVTLGTTAVFESEPGSHADGADVVYIAVDSPDLVVLNSVISEAVPVTDTHPEYVPHITLAYVTKGDGAKFAGDETLKGTVVTFGAISFSDVEGNLTEIPLGEAVASRGTAAAFRSNITAILTRCCGCGPYDEKPPASTDEARAIEVPLLRRSAELALRGVELGMTLWKTAETEAVRNIGSALIYDGMWRFDRCSYLLTEWYGEELAALAADIDTGEAERALVGYTATRAGAVFSAKNLGKIDQVIEIMGELRAAATKPTADDVPGDDEAARALRARSRAAGDASSTLAEIGTTLAAITEAAGDVIDGALNTPPESALSAAVEGLAALLIDIEDVLTDVAALTGEANPSPDDTSARATRAAARRLRVSNLVRRARAMDAGDGSMTDLVAGITESLALLTEVVAKVPEASLVDVAAAIDTLLDSAKKILADLTATPAEERTFIRIKSGVAPHELGTKSHIRVLVPDASGDRPEESPTPRRSISLLSD